MNEWWRGLAPAQATIGCGGNSHRLRWEAGRIHALDHDDAESEQTLAALAGESCTCLDLIDAWDRHCEDIRVLVLGSRGPADILATQDDPAAQLGVARPQVVAGGGAGPRVSRARRVGTLSAMGRPGPSGWTSYAPGGGPLQPARSRKVQAENELVALVGLGGGLPDRLVATVAAAWQERLARRVFAVMRGWLGTSAPPLQLTMIGEKAAPKLISEDGHIRAELRFGWLLDVWAQGLAVVWGRFCLSANTDDGRMWTLTTVGPDVGPPSLIVVKLAD